MHKQDKYRSEDKKDKIYTRYYRLFLFISLSLLIVSIVYLIIFYIKTGDIMYKDVSLTGGSTITVYSDININKIKPYLPKDSVVRQLSDLQTGKQIAFSVETTLNVSIIKSRLQEILGYNLTEENSSIEFTGSALSESFYMDLIRALVVAFILMAAVVFFIFRTPVPSIAVILAAVTDIIVTLAIIDFFGLRLSTAGIAAFLMLLGYSVDTDIMLTNRVLKRKESLLDERVISALSTGMTMTLTSFIAIFSAFLVSLHISSVLTEIFMILSIGLVVDIISTWLGNASILVMYCKKKNIV